MPWLRTVAPTVKDVPAARLSLLTVGDSTTRSGLPTPTLLTMTSTPVEQLFCVLDSRETESTQAP